MTLRDLFRRKTPEPPYRWHVERKLEQQVRHAIQVERAGGKARFLEMVRANQNAAATAIQQAGLYSYPTSFNRFLFDRFLLERGTRL